MGPIISKKQNLQSQELKMIHPRFKHARRFIKEKEQIQISLPFMNQIQVKQWQEKFKKYANQDCLLLPASYQSNKVGVCGTNGICNVRYQNYPYVLKDQIHDRITKNLQAFQNKEIWYILFIILEAASLFHQNNQKLGDIRPINVFISDNGQTKIANQYTFLNELTNFQKSLLEKEVTYVAPQQMKHLLFKSQSQQNFILAQSFSIGLTLMDAVILSHSEDIYNLTNFRIDYEKLSERIQILKKTQRLDQILKQIIVGLVSVNHQERLNCDEVFKWLKAFKQEILNFQPFEISQWPFVGFNQDTHKTVPNQQSNITNKPISVPSNFVNLPQPLNSNKNIQYYQDKKGTSWFASNHPTPLYRAPQPPAKSISPQPNNFYNQAVKNQSPVYGQLRLRLEKIDEQLARSRQLFPS